MTFDASQARGLARRELERRAAHWELARRDPLFLVSFMSAVDEGDGSRFGFQHVRWPLAAGEVPTRSARDVGPQDSWRWQRLAGEQMLRSKRFMALKGRQIGVTWLWLAVDVAEAILMPGSTSAVYRQKEADAIDSVRRWWILFQSLPEFWKQHITVVTPDRGVEPGREGVRLRFPDGAMSRVIPMTSSDSSGHGKTLRRALADEAAHIEKLNSIKKAIEPAAAQGVAKIGYISTANGRSNPETGEGNRFHYDWVNAGDGVTRLFLPFDVHPGRDQEWYDTVPRGVLGMKTHEVHEQYPRNEHEAFALTNRVWFDSQDLEHYSGLVKQPLYQGGAVRKLVGGPRWSRTTGPWKVFVDPEPERHYAIGADVATGRGTDFSAAVIIDLETMMICAQLREKLDADLFAYQLSVAGQRYNRAKLAVEIGGGYGDAVIIPLRDGRDGLAPYPNLYRHRYETRIDKGIGSLYGFPMTSKTRPLVLSLLDKALRDRSLPYVTDDLLYEMSSFVEWETGTSPRAQEGANDDLVMATAVTLELFRRYGHHANRWTRETVEKAVTRRVRLDGRNFEKRYGRART